MGVEILPQNIITANTITVIIGYYSSLLLLLFISHVYIINIDSVKKHLIEIDSVHIVCQCVCQCVCVFNKLFANAAKNFANVNLQIISRNKSFWRNFSFELQIFYGFD